MSNNSINTNVIAQALVAQAQNALKSFRGTTVEANKRSIWVKAPKSAEQTLKGLGYKYAESKDAWWFTYADTTAPAQKPAKTAPKGQKAQPKPAKKDTQPKAEKVYAELPAEVQAQVKAIAQKKFPGVTVTIVGAWVRLSGEATKGQKDAIKAEGFHWASAEDKKYWSREIPQAWMSAQVKTAPKAEPKKAQPKAKTTPKKGGVVRLAEMYA